MEKGNVKSRELTGRLVSSVGLGVNSPQRVGVVLVAAVVRREEDGVLMKKGRGG
jgi:hypothetical protein